MLTASYAKINLFLELIGKLSNNYHQVNTILCSIDLFDLLSYEPLESPEIILTCNIPSLVSTSNLVYKVASCLKEQFNIPAGIKIHLEKHIPVSAGLGGGSSNAANCILALNEIWQLNLSRTKMHKIASQFGSDINFFLEGGTAKGENRGEIIIKLPPILLNNILLVNPGLELSSAEAYKLAALPKKLYAFYPGTSILHPLAAPQIMGKEHTITAYVEIPEGGAEGVLACNGGEFGGWSLFMKNKKLHFVHNYLKIQEFTVSSPNQIPAG